jgi:hypothetical protein
VLICGLLAFGLLWVLTAPVCAQSADPPTLGQFQQLKEAAYEYGAALNMSTECGFDHTAADQDFKSALRRWSINADQKRELLNAMGLGGTFMSDAPKNARPADWCDQGLVDEMFVAIHKLGAGEAFIRPTKTPSAR